MFIEIIIVFRSDDGARPAYGHAGLSEVMEKIFNRDSPYGESLQKLQDEFYDTLADVKPELYAKSNGIYVFANLTVY